MNQCPLAPKYSIGAVLNFFENSRKYSRINVNDTGGKLFNGVNDTGEKFIAGVNEKNLKSKISCQTPFKIPPFSLLSTVCPNF